MVVAHSGLWHETCVGAHNALAMVACSQSGGCCRMHAGATEEGLVAHFKCGRDDMRSVLCNLQEELEIFVNKSGRFVPI